MQAGGTPDTGTAEFWSVRGTPWVTITDMSNNDSVESTEKCVTAAGISSKRLSVLPPGTLLYSMYASLGHVAELGIPAATNQAILGLEVNARLNKRYAYWQLKALQPYLNETAASNTQDNLNAEKVKNLPFAFLPLAEQTRIANFLDEQTARIDALIAEKERLDALLGEYRGSLISAAVTGQLDPTTGEAPRRAQGGGGGVSKVVFSRKLPANWSRMRLRHIARFVSGGTPSKDNGAFWQGQIPWFSPKDFSSRVLVDSEDHISPEAVEVSATTMLTAGTPVFVVRSGILRHTIPIALLGVNGCINQDVKGVLLKENLEARYFVYVVEGFQAELIDEWTKQGATVESIEQQFVSNTYFPIPSSQEQTRIANFLDERTAQIDDLRSHCREHISLLREYRSSLISAAVTGQLDIDNFGRQVGGGRAEAWA